MSLPGLERVEVTSVGQLRAWLEAHHAQDDGVWLVTWKKHTGPRYVARDAVLDELLRVGWTDGRLARLDDDRVMQLVSPRRVGHWSRSYQVRVARLLEQGQMHPAGLAAVERAKADGGWEELRDVDDLVVPPDLATALDERPGARAFFDGVAPSSRRFALRWLHLARKDSTRRARVERLAELSARGERLPGS